MHKYLLMLSLLAASASAQERGWKEVNTSVLCGPFLEIVKILQRESYQETPLWIGQSSEDTSRYALFFNEKKGNWTLVRYAREIGCVIGIG